MEFGIYANSFGRKWMPWLSKWNLFCSRTIFHKIFFSLKVHINVSSSERLIHIARINFCLIKSKGLKEDHTQARRQRWASGARPPIWNVCPHFTFGPLVAAYIQYSIFKMWPPFWFLVPLLLYPGDGPAPTLKLQLKLRYVFRCVFLFAKTSVRNCRISRWPCFTFLFQPSDSCRRQSISVFSVFKAVTDRY